MADLSTVTITLAGPPANGDRSVNTAPILKASNGNLFALVQPPVDAGSCIASFFRSINQGASWVEVDALNAPQNVAVAPAIDALKGAIPCQKGDLVYVIYFEFDAGTPTDSKLSVKVFDMATSTWGLVTNSSLGAVPGRCDDVLNLGTYLAFYRAVDNTVVVVANAGTELDSGMACVSFPYFAKYDIGGDTWSGTWTRMVPTTAGTPKIIISAGIDPVGRVHVILLTEGGSRTSQVVLHADDSLSANVLLPVPAFLNAGTLVPVAVCTAAEIVIPFIAVDGSALPRILMAVRGDLSDAPAWVVETVFPNVVPNQYINAPLLAFDGTVYIMTAVVLSGGVHTLETFASPLGAGPWTGPTILGTLGVINSLAGFSVGSLLYLFFGPGGSGASSLSLIGPLPPAFITLTFKGEKVYGVS